MATSLQAWRTESSGGTQLAAAIAMVVIGLILAYGFRHFEGPGLTESRAGFLLGVLLLAIGAGAMLFAGKQAIVVDPVTKRILIEQAGRFGAKVRSIPFREVAELHVGQFGHRNNGSITYHVAARLKTGEEIALFFGFYEGRHDRSVAESRCTRLRTYLEQRAS